MNACLLYHMCNEVPMPILLKEMIGMKTLIAAVLNDAQYKWFGYSERSDNAFLYIDFDKVELVNDEQILTFYNGPSPFQPVNQFSIITSDVKDVELISKSESEDILKINFKDGTCKELHAIK